MAALTNYAMEKAATPNKKTFPALQFTKSQIANVVWQSFHYKERLHYLAVAFPSTLHHLMYLMHTHTHNGEDKGGGGDEDTQMPSLFNDFEIARAHCIN